MSEIILKRGKELNENQVLSLYDDAGWTSYTKDISKLMGAIKASLFVVTAWEGDNLIGLIRVIGDGLTIIYIQDILVKKNYKRRGIGNKLLNETLKEYKEVRQKVLLTDDSEETRGFYEHNGFASCDKGTTVAFAKLG